MRVLQTFLYISWHSSNWYVYPPHPRWIGINFNDPFITIRMQEKQWWVTAIAKIKKKKKKKKSLSLFPLNSLWSLAFSVTQLEVWLESLMLWRIQITCKGNSSSWQSAATTRYMHRDSHNFSPELWSHQVLTTEAIDFGGQRQANGSCGNTWPTESVNIIKW